MRRTWTRGKTYREFDDEAKNLPIKKIAHGHHIIFKKSDVTSSDAARKYASTAKDILLYYGINPYFGKENLAYAPLYVHTVDTIKYMSLEVLKLFDKKGSDGKPLATLADIVTKLKKFADDWVEHKLPGMLPGK